MKRSGRFCPRNPVSQRNRVFQSIQKPGFSNKPGFSESPETRFLKETGFFKEESPETRFLKETGFFKETGFLPFHNSKRNAI
jgi:hypothetical protein